MQMWSSFVSRIKADVFELASKSQSAGRPPSPNPRDGTSSISQACQIAVLSSFCCRRSRPVSSNGLCSRNITNCHRSHFGSRYQIGRCALRSPLLCSAVSDPGAAEWYCTRRGLNPGPSAYEAGALPLRHEGEMRAIFGEGATVQGRRNPPTPAPASRGARFVGD